jgi:hypothetical protein
VLIPAADLLAMESRHAKEKAEWEAANMQFSRKLAQVESAFIAERAEWERQLASVIAGHEAIQRFAEIDKQAVVAAALAAEKERVLGIIMDWFNYRAFDNVVSGSLTGSIYQPAKVTLPAGHYWCRDKKAPDGSRWWIYWCSQEFTPSPDSDYIKAEPPPNPYAKAAEPGKGQTK